MYLLIFFIIFSFRDVNCQKALRSDRIGLGWVGLDWVGSGWLMDLNDLVSPKMIITICINLFPFSETTITEIIQIGIRATLLSSQNMKNIPIFESKLCFDIILFQN